MILRDPVHGLVSFEGSAERVIMALLATREVQRLRRVRQLGFTSLVFPGAEHSRFAHALGAAHVMVRLQERIRQCDGELPPDQQMDDSAADDALAAAFLHDLGHGPFSHLFEDVLPNAKSHESWTLEAIVSPDTEVHRALESLSSGMADRVASMLNGQHRLGYLGRSVAGVLDVDRCDYLLRDSHMTGVSYGLYDLEWLLRALSFAQAPDERGEWVLAIEGRKGLPPVEGYFLGRHFMYRQVYHHKATRAAECLIRGIFVRLAELIQDGHSPGHVPAALQAASLGEPVGLGDYFSLDDATLLTSFAQWEDATDPVLQDLARRIRNRALFKTVPLPSGPGTESLHQEALTRARDIAKRHGFRTDLYVWLDDTSDVPYSEPEDDRSATGLWITLRHQSIQRLGDASFVLGQMRNKSVHTSRLVFPPDIRDEVISAIEEVLA